MKLKKRKLLFLLIVMIFIWKVWIIWPAYNVNDGADGSLNDNNILLDLITRCSTDIGTEFYEDSLIELNKFIYQLYYKKCRFLDNEFERFRVFENLYILLNHCQNFPHLKFNIYTFNSSLIFPNSINRSFSKIILCNYLKLNQSFLQV